MGSEDITESMTIMVVGATTVDCACCRIEEGEQVRDAVAFILEILPNRLLAPGWQVWRKTLECLDAGAFIKTVEVFRRLQVAADDVLHFGKKVWIGDLEVIFTAVRSQCMLLENALYGCAADGPTD